MVYITTNFFTFGSKLEHMYTLPDTILNFGGGSARQALPMAPPPPYQPRPEPNFPQVRNFRVAQNTAGYLEELFFCPYPGCEHSATHPAAGSYSGTPATSPNYTPAADSLFLGFKAPAMRNHLVQKHGYFIAKGRKLKDFLHKEFPGYFD